MHYFASKELKDGSRLTIVPAQVADAEAILRYVNQVGGESEFLTFGKNEFGKSLDEERKYLASLAAPYSGFLFKGTVNGKVASLASIQRASRPRIRHVGELGISVLKEYWGRGIARFMCEALLRHARENGFRKINLRVREDNTVAIELYEKLGFRHEGASSRALLINGVFFAEKNMGIHLDA